MASNYQICKRCVMDTSDPTIRFDAEGICNHCTSAIGKLSKPPYSLSKEAKRKLLTELVEKIKKSRGPAKYDCIIGVSGGVDSTYVAYLMKEWGLNPLAVHLDNGWNSEIATQNIEHVCKKLGIDLFTHVIDWGEFRDLQLSFLKASTPDSEIPSDHAIYSLMFHQARKEGLKYILAGYNYASESIMPKAWSNGHFDWRYIQGVQKRFGTKQLTTYPHMSYYTFNAFEKIARIKVVSTLDYIEYDKTAAKSFIMDKLGWHDYGAKHHESTYTKFYQSYILPKKFGYDKRRAHLSSLIAAGQMARGGALLELEKSPYDEVQIKDDIKYAVNKLDITEGEFEAIMNAPKKCILDYPNYSMRPDIVLIEKTISALSKIKRGLSRA
ncbi:MAG: N-acetyl sugar amidotransferase [Methanobacteriota archaeon]